MLSILPTKLIKESSITRMIQFSVMIQVQERFPAQSNPSHEQSTLKSLISGFNKKLPKKESKFTMWTLKIKLLISLPKVLLGHWLKNWRKDLDWYHQRKCDLSFPSPTWISVPYYGVDNCETVFQRWISEKTKFIQFVNPASYSDLEEVVNEKQHHESEDGVLFTLQR